MRMKLQFYQYAQFVSQSFRKVFYILILLLLSWNSVGVGAAELNRLAKDPAVIESNCCDLSIDQSFDAFFAAYRESIKSGDYEVIYKISRFPFIFKGQLDMEGSLEVGRDEFIGLFPKFLLLDTDVELDGKSYEMSTKHSIVTSVEKPNFIDADRVRLHDFVFEFVDSQWLFVMAYTRMDDLIDARGD